MDPHRVVIVGAGFGGLAAARALRKAPVAVTIIDSRNHHTFQPLLYQVATAGLDGDDICFPIRGIFARQPNARVRLGEVIAVDLDLRQVTLADHTLVGYDTLILAPGAVSNTFGVPGVEEYAFSLKSLSDALAIRTHTLLQFEQADAHPDRTDDGTLTMVIAGGGPTGVEMAGGLAELCTSALRRDFPDLDTGKVRIVLLEATDRVLGSFHPRLSSRAFSTLESTGVEVLLGAVVAEVQPDQVRLADGRCIPSRTMIWTAGVRAHPLAETLGVELTKTGRVVVEPDLSVPGHPEVFVVGDLAGSIGLAGTLLPQVAPVAMQGAKHAAQMTVGRLNGRETEPFRYVDKGSMATIGRNHAVAELPFGIRLWGPIGWIAWLVLHLLMLVGFRNRANVLVNWAWSYATYDRASRIIA